MKHTLLVLALLAGAAHATQPTVGGGGMLNNNTGGNAAQSQSAISNSFSAGGQATATNYGSTATATAGQGGAGGTINAAGGIGNTTFERSAPGVAVSAPHQAPTSCRGGVSLGGSNTSGSGVLGFPIGNDETCLAIVRAALMADDSSFTDEDRIRNKCSVEGMGKMSACKRLVESDTTDPYIRRRMGLQ